MSPHVFVHGLTHLRFPSKIRNQFPYRRHQSSGKHRIQFQLLDTVLYCHANTYVRIKTNTNILRTINSNSISRRRRVFQNHALSNTLAYFASSPHNIIPSNYSTPWTQLTAINSVAPQLVCCPQSESTTFNRFVASSKSIPFHFVRKLMEMRLTR